VSTAFFFVCITTGKPDTEQAISVSRDAQSEGQNLYIFALHPIGMNAVFGYSWMNGGMIELRSSYTVTHEEAGRNVSSQRLNVEPR
jgi:hypothetical protein